MKMTPVMVIGGIGLAACAAHEGAIVERDGVVLTTSGAVRGRLVDGIGVWKGIPYAAPPVEDRRWRPPAPAIAWDGVREATGFGAVCVQTPGPDEPDGTAVGSEDCLTINVWSPAPARGAARPVLVFVHGGYFAWGTASARGRGVDRYDAATLARATGAVVVTFNYRVGPFGFLAHPALAADDPHGASGNYGLADQLAALAWVQGEIEAFGGDPARVTVFGHSAGAISVAALVASPLGRGLFAGAIMHSGSAGANPKDRAEALGVEVAEALGCDDVACLRARSAAEVMAAGPYRFQGVHWGPSVDGWILPDAPLALIARGAGSRVPLTIGVTANEFTTMIANYLTAPVVTEEEYTAWVRAWFPGIAARVIATYPMARYPSAIAAIVDLMGDVAFVCPSRRLARAAAAMQETRRFVWRHGLAGGPGAAYRAGHGIDLLFLFGTFEATTATTAEERVLGETLRRAWGRIAAGEAPGGDGLPAWPVYDAERDTALEIDGLSTLGDGFHREACDVWDSFGRPAG